MSRFTGPLVIEELRPGRRWRLREPIVYEVGAEGSGVTIVVPAGTETDGATLPAALRLILAVWGTYGRAAAMHDYLYAALRTGLPPEGWSAPLDRDWADAEFHTAMIACGTSRPLAWTIWAAVRLFGARFARPAT